MILHGSTRTDLTVLEPIRHGVETEETIDVNGVYAAPDAILTIYFAICDRKKIVGMNNGYFTGKDHEGRNRRFYHLAVGMDSLRDDPWTDGVVYILPRDTFREIRNANWVSAIAVRPLAKLPVCREDIPFDIWGMATWSRKLFINMEADFPFLEAVEIYPIRPKQFEFTGEEDSVKIRQRDLMT